MNTNNQHLFICPPKTHPEYAQHWIELSKSALFHNAAQFKTWLGEKTEIAAVIKANAYGHGLLEMAYLYEQCPDIAALCVINLTEGLLVRNHGVKKPIFVIGYLDAPYETIITYDIQVVLYDLTIAEKLNKIAEQHQQKIKVHIKFDTGMTRLGVQAHELESFVQQVENFPWLEIACIFTHFAQSYHEERTAAQETVFAQALNLPYGTHSSNSHGVLTIRHKTYNFARIGIGLYGYLQRHNQEIQSQLQPVLSFKTKILQIKTVQAGHYIGYDGLFQAPCNMTIAVIALGYSEGLDARLAEKGNVIINDQLAPIVGRICMNLTIVDVSNIPDCKKGQTVTILGKEKTVALTAYDWSAISGASVYNHLTKLGYTVPKVIVP